MPENQVAANALEWTGEIGPTNADSVYSLTMEYIGKYIENRTVLVFIDMRKVRSLSGYGVHIMKLIYKDAMKQGVAVIFRNTPPNIASIINLCGADQLLLTGSQ